ncbi:MAG: hypothetical protein GXO29_06025 [Thermotogae bacterium]|nr:hypothetical protein [Thermotogota bacterium]
MILLLASLSEVRLQIRLSEMLIGRSVSGYIASRSGRIFDEVEGIVFVGRANVWFWMASPFAPCSDLKVLYGEQPADVRLLATPRYDGDITLSVWSKSAPDRLVILRLASSIRKDTLVYHLPSFRLESAGERIKVKDTTEVLKLAGSRITCEERDLKVFRLGKSLQDPTFVWTGKELWFSDGDTLYAYRQGRLVEIYVFPEPPALTSNGEGVVVAYLPGRDELVIFDGSRRGIRKLKRVSRDVRGEFSGIHMVRELSTGKEGLKDWVAILLFREGKRERYVKVKRSGEGFVLESGE